MAIILPEFATGVEGREGMTLQTARPGFPSWSTLLGPPRISSGLALEGIQPHRKCPLDWSAPTTRTACPFHMQCGTEPAVLRL